MLQATAFFFLCFLAGGAFLSLLAGRTRKSAFIGSLRFGAGAALVVLGLLYWAAPIMASEEAVVSAPLQRVISSLPLAGVASIAFVMSDLAVAWWARKTGIDDQGEQ